MKTYLQPSMDILYFDGTDIETTTSTTSVRQLNEEMYTSRNVNSTATVDVRLVKVQLK